MAFVDEGHGPPIVFVHGMPTWSHLWRAFVGPLSTSHRCIAVDHLGFGRSDKPADADYHPRVLSEQLSALVDHLGLRDITLVVHDFGGPIGLGHAVRHPETIDRITIFNTWMWSLVDHEGARSVDRAVRGAFGHIMYRWLNGSARWLIPRVLAKGNRLDPAAHRAYIDATRSSSERVGQLTLARSLIGASEWYDELWRDRDRLADKPMQLLWGTQDPTFGPDELQRWTEAFPQAEVNRFEDAGHFVQEEAPERALTELQRFVGPR
jgi:haloalkane dehalogenase